VTNIEKIVARRGNHVLVSLREALGAEDGAVDDEQTAALDIVINATSPEQLCRWWSQYEIGDPTWADSILDLYKAVIQ
jgi:hypothetical protein